ncbi:MAG: transposase [Iphinoe sp. HA4291-MV1]|nr:transposase [Iphinoe sp. HA4291-MV1]
MSYFRQQPHIYQKIARQRKQFHNESANRLISKGAKHIFVEDLNTKGLTKRNKVKQDENGKYLSNGQAAKSGLTKSILDNGWSQFVDILTHKAANAGMSVVKVNPKNTSQICSCCNAYVPKDLSVRVHECACGYIADRDVNAAINIKKVGWASSSLKNAQVGQPAREAHTVICDSVWEYVTMYC